MTNNEQRATNNEKRLAVIGCPIEHSPSPAMHNAALEACGLAPSYERWRVTPEDLDHFVARLRREFAGCNVTIPHKVTIMRHMDALDGTARVTGAMNTVVRRDGELHGYNTDVEGFATALQALGCDPAGARAVVFGAGGAARAVVTVLDQNGCRLTIAARDSRQAQDLANPRRARALTLGSPELLDELRDAELLINTTPLGMSHLAQLSPLPPGTALSTAAFAVDLVYGRETPFLSECRAQGLRVSDGLEMLVRQGAASFRLWLSLEPDINVMREACRNWLFARAPAAPRPDDSELDTQDSRPKTQNSFLLKARNSTC